MRTKRIAMTTSSFAVASLLLAGCSAGNTAASSGDLSKDIAAVTAEQLDGTTIQMSRMFGDCEETTAGVTDTSKATSECEAIQILTNKFNAENEFGITVERLGGSEWASYYDAFNASLAGGAPADIANLHAHALPDYAARNSVIPIDTDAMGIDLADASDAARGGVEWDGATYAVPFDLHAILAHVNVDLFTQAGLVNADGTPKLPTSAEEFLADAKIVKEKTGKFFISIAYANDPMGFRLFSMLVNQQGGELISDDGKTVNIDTPEAQNALEFINTLVDEGYADRTVDYAGSTAQFLAGDSAVLMNGTWAVNEYANTAPFTYQVADFPTLYEQPATWAASHTWVIPRQKSGDVVKYRAAEEFAKFLYNNTDTWAIATGHMSPRVSVLESDAYLNAVQRSNYVETAKNNAHLVPHIKNWQPAEDAILEQISSTWLNDKDIAAALTEAQARVEQALSK
ncbi:extracellular solute-binding protein [Glaciibacter psychrotolerans]|uniref:Multiple sugar transport system substrate-binding protein n=1 Tax=Glaciibacter psychrotolerans TaxID=670054 RepID=A0A7Z0EF50_9MICO|nr:extracellular solute-binding protein [Leifsonia psychrotolerans]NYJ20368.1 multiple sugar transport system substrate-binding protein [Leifsonia psychrotolerans]